MPDAIDPLQAFRMDGRVAIVTGASGGLGARFARALDAVGARLVLAARREERLEELAAELDDAIAFECDLADLADLDRLVESATEHYGRVDVLVNNAAIRTVTPAVDDTEEAFEEVLRVNLTACYGLARRVAADMIARGEPGSIVNIASILAHVGIGRIPLASYTASKAGLVNLTRELAAQWGRDGIRVNVISPGWFSSEMTTDTFEDERTVEWISRRTVLGRVGEQRELDGALLYLASDASTYTTGHALRVDGGWTVL